MGCAASSATYGPPPNLNVANGGAEVGLGEITSRRTGYVLNSNALDQGAYRPWNAWFVRDGGIGKILDVRDHTGRVVYQILPHGEPEKVLKNMMKTTAARRSMHILKASDKSKLAVLDRNVVAKYSEINPVYGTITSDSFTLYSYAPNFEGQASTKTDRDGEALYPYAVLPDPGGNAEGLSLPRAINEKAPPTPKVFKLFKTSNDPAEAEPVLRYRCVEKEPARLIFRSIASAAEQPDDLNILATAASDFYLQTIGGGSGAAPAKYFSWEKPNEWGVDCAAGVDSLLVIVATIAVAPGNLGCSQPQTHGGHGFSGGVGF